MSKMGNADFQKQSKPGRARFSAGFAVMAILTCALFFIVGSNAPNMTFAICTFAPLVSVVFAGGAFFALHLLKKAEYDSFDEGMQIAMESVPMVCSLFDMNNNIKYCNDKAPKLFGYKNREEYARNCGSRFPELQPDGTRTGDLEAKAIHEVKTAGSATVEWYQKAANGELLPLRLTMVRTHFQGEQHMLEFTTDRREELKAERQETAAKEKMQAILDASPLLCTVADAQGNLLDVNKAAEDLFHLSDKQFFLKNYEMFLPPRQPDGSNSLQKISEQMKEALSKGQYHYEFMYQRQDSTPIQTEEFVTSVTVDGKTILICYTRDMRELYASKEKEALIQQSIQTMMEQLNANVSKQATAVTESAAAIEEMVANIQSVTNVLTKNAGQVKELQSASEVANKGINEVVTDIRGIAAESESLLEINSVMANIASQTNLLSMNAAIEAAHAGDSGRGFAVVANEIRKLAESSANQSKTIRTVLKSIKASIDKITKSAENVLNRFDTIDGSIKTVAEQERGVLNAMEEQKQGSEQVLHAIGQVSDITQRVKNDAQQMVRRQQAVTL